MSGARILIVDDEAALRDGVTFALRRAGYESESVASGEEALRRLDEAAFDVAIVDVMLPGVSGFDLCRTLRDGGDIPIILLTALDSEFDRVQGLEIGADDYVVKPFSTRELVSRVQAILRRRHLDAAAAGRIHAFNVGQLRVDLLHHAAFWGQRRLPLTDSEFRILTFLASAEGATVSRPKIMRQLWDSDHVSDARVPDVHVHAIRRKIRLAGGDPRVAHRSRTGVCADNSATPPSSRAASDSVGRARPRPGAAEPRLDS